MIKDDMFQHCNTYSNFKEVPRIDIYIYDKKDIY